MYQVTIEFSKILSPATQLYGRALLLGLTPVGAGAFMSARSFKILHGILSIGTRHGEKDVQYLK